MASLLCRDFFCFFFRQQLQDHPPLVEIRFGPQKLSITSDVLILYEFFHLAAIPRIPLDAIRSAELDIDQMIFSPGIEGVSEERQTGAVYLDGIVFTAAHCSHL